MSKEQYQLVGRKVEDLRAKDDFYPTPQYVTKALLNNHSFDGDILDKRVTGSSIVWADWEVA